MDLNAFECFRQDGVWLKGNLHSHTTNSDGEVSAQELTDWYRQHGYDFLAITDHDVITDVSTLDSGGMLLIPGLEFGYDPVESPGWVLDMLGIQVAQLPDFLDPAGTGRVHYGDRTVSPQRIIDWINAAGGLAVMCHPYFMINMTEPYLTYRDYIGMEAYNYVCQDQRGRGHHEVYWDAMLYRGKKLWGFAADDSHRADFGHAWIEVKAKERSIPALIQSIRQGHFYATTGIKIYDIQYEDGVVRLSFDRPCDVVAFPWSSKLYHTRMDENTSMLVNGQRRYFAEVTNLPHNRYLRVELTDAHGNKAYTNPVYFD